MEITNKKIQLDTLVEFKPQLFPPQSDNDFEKLVESVKANGVITPIVVRKLSDEQYEILSGHNRVRAAKKADLEEIEASIKENITDDEAMLIYIESNQQRSFKDLPLSKKAQIIKTHFDTVKSQNRQGQRNDLLYGDVNESDATCYQLGNKSMKRKKSVDETADKFSNSRTEVVRYLRIARLPEWLREKLDAGEIKFTPAVELSYLSDDELGLLKNILCGKSKYRISLKTAKALHGAKGQDNRPLSEDEISQIISEQEDKAKTKSSIKIDDVDMAAKLSSLGKEDLNWLLKKGFKALENKQS